MSELVEKVAREIALRELSPHSHEAFHWPDDCGPTALRTLRESARAAIAMVLKAMREPTPEMIKAMNDAIMEHVFCDGYESTGYYAAYEPDDPAAPFKAALAAFTRTTLDADTGV